MKKFIFNQHTSFKGISKKECEDYFINKESLLPDGALITLERSYSYNFDYTNDGEQTKNFNELYKELIESKFFSIVDAINVDITEKLIHDLSDTKKGFIVEDSVTR